MGYKSIQCKFTKNERVWLLNDFNLLRRQPEHPRQDVRHRAQKWNVGLERRKGLGTSRADVWGNARHFCDGELN